MPHKGVIQLVSMKLKIFRTAIPPIGDGPIRIAAHAFCKTLEGGTKKGFIIGVADEIFGADHEALPVESEFEGRAEFGFGVTLAFLNGAGIRIIDGNQTIWDRTLAFEFELRLLIED
jgi:hypothetical protein